MIFLIVLLSVLITRALMRANKTVNHILSTELYN